MLDRLTIDTDAQERAIELLDRLAGLGVLTKRERGDGTAYYDPTWRPAVKYPGTDTPVATVMDGGLAWNNPAGGEERGVYRLERIVERYNRETRRAAAIQVDGDAPTAFPSPAELQAARKRLGHISQASLAQLLGVSTRAVETWESPAGNPPAYLARALRDLERELADLRQP